MAWIEVHQSLMSHRKVLAASALLDISENEMIGSLVRFWCWSLDNAPTGSLDQIPPGIIARAAGWQGDPDQYVQALIQVSFLDNQDGTPSAIHNWPDYTGKLIDRRERNKEAMRQARARAKDVLTTCATREATCKATVPNRTQHNHTVEEREVPVQSTYNAGTTEGQNNGTTAASLSSVQANAGTGLPAVATPLAAYLENFRLANPQQKRDLEKMDAECGRENALAAVEWAARKGQHDTGAIWECARKMQRDGVGKKPTAMRARDVPDQLGPLLGSHPDKGVL